MLPVKMDKQIFSKLFMETAVVAEDGTVSFENGAVYESGEVEILKKCTAADRKGIHLVKTIFGGDLEFLGEYSGPDVVPPQKIVTFKSESGHEKRMSAIHSFDVKIGETITFSDGVNNEKYEVAAIETDVNSVPVEPPKKNKKEINSESEQMSLFSGI